jgi:hypothetical protein
MHKTALNRKGRIKRKGKGIVSKENILFKVKPQADIKVEKFWARKPEISVELFDLYSL